MPTPSQTDVFIVGAGPTGMTLAMELAIQGQGGGGVRFRIVDKLATRCEHSRALALHARTMEVLNRYGAADDGGAAAMHELTAASQRIAGNFIWVGGRRYAGFDLGSSDDATAAVAVADDTQFLGPYSVSQVETEAFLERRLAERGVCVERGVTVSGVAQDADGATVRLVREDGAEETVRCKYVVGTDGAHSVVRHAAAMKFEGDAYEQEFILADARLDWALPDSAGKFHVMLGSGFLLIIPMQGNRARLIASRPRARARASHDADATPTLDDFRRFLAEMLPADGSVPLPRLYDPCWLARFHLHHRCVDQYRDRRLFVAGDAAHIHSPAGGQGMNAGIQDSVNLGWKLARVLRGDAPDALLDTYHAERRPVGRQLLRQTDRAFRFATSTAAPLRALRNLLLPWVLPRATRDPATGRAMLRFLSQLRVRYRRSPIVRTAPGYAGAVRGGYRVPDGRIRMEGEGEGEGGDGWLHNLLRGPTYHVLLFAGRGGADQAVRECRKRFLMARTDETPVHVVRYADGPNIPGAVVDIGGQLHARYGFDVKPGFVYVRPDGYVESVGHLDTFVASELLRGPTWQSGQEEESGSWSSGGKSTLFLTRVGVFVFVLMVIVALYFLLSAPR